MVFLELKCVQGRTINLPAHQYLSLANTFVEDAALHNSHCKCCGYTYYQGSQEDKERRKLPEAVLKDFT